MNTNHFESEFKSTERKYKSKFVAPQSSIKSPDLTAPIGNSCRRIKPGESGFLSKGRSNFHDIDANGNTQFPAILKSQSGEIRKLKRKFIEGGRVFTNKITAPVEKFEVKVKDGGIVSMRQMTKADGSKITSKFGGRYIQKKDLGRYSLKILGLNGVSDGVYEV